MVARNALIFKWTLYALAALLCLAVQGIFLQRLTVWGVIPFLYPLLAVIPATYEGPTAGTSFALAVGVVCDLLLPDAFPCLYTLVFPLAGLLAGLLSRSVLRAGFLCSLVGGAAAFLLLDLSRCLLLWFRQGAAWAAGFSVMGREMLLTAPLVFPVTLLFRAVHRRTTD